MKGAFLASFIAGASAGPVPTPTPTPTPSPAPTPSPSLSGTCDGFKPDKASYACYYKGCITKDTTGNCQECCSGCHLESYATKGTYCMEDKEISLGFLAIGAGIGLLGSSADGLAKPATKLSESCHPWEGRIARIFVNGNASISVNKWLSFTSAGHWMVANGDDVSQALPWLFRAGDQCGEYYLRSTDFTTMPQLDSNDDHYLSSTWSGNWIRAVYSFSDAVPIRFLVGDDGRFKMLNTYPDSRIGDPDHLYFGFTVEEDYMYWLRSIYDEHAAMNVNLVWADSDIVITDGPVPTPTPTPTPSPAPTPSPSLSGTCDGFKPDKASYACYYKGCITKDTTGNCQECCSGCHLESYATKGTYCMEDKEEVV